MSKKRKVLMVVANPSVSTTTGWPVGFWASELIHPYDAFVRQGYEVTIASPNGGKVELDAYSDPRDASGYSKDDRLSLEYLGRPDFVALLGKTARVSGLRAEDFDAVVVAGGQSPMFTFKDAAGLQKLFLEFFESGKIAAALCHGTCLLLYLKNPDGSPFVRGRKMTGFANSEEDYADKAVGRKLMPFRIEDEANKLGAEFSTKPAFQPYAIRDGNLITGQQQHSGGEVVKLVMEALEGDNPLKIAFIGCGQVGGPLADHLQRLGHDVTLAARDANSDAVKKALARNSRLKVAAPRDAVKAADVVFLATPFQANEAALKEVAAELKGKVLVDCTNPVGPGLTHGLNNVQSGSEMVQKLAPEAKVVKAFTIYGFENFEDNAYPAYTVKPAMFFCGNDVAAKKTVRDLIRQLGWEPLDVGGLEQALHLEHMTLLWVRMVRLNGASPHLVWARLTR